MVKKYRNRPIGGSPTLNPNVAAFIPVARRESNTSLNPSATPFVPGSAPTSDTASTKPVRGKDSPKKNSKESEKNGSSKTTANTEIKKAEEAKVQPKSEVENVPVVKEEEKNKVEKKEEGDLSRSETPTSVASADDDPLNTSASIRVGMSKAQKRNLNRNGKSKSFETIDLTSSPGSEPQSSGSSSGSSGKKKKRTGAPAVSPSMEKKQPLPAKKTSESEQHVSIVMPLPSLKRKIPDAHIGEGDQQSTKTVEQTKEKSQDEINQAKEYDLLITENEQLKTQMIDFETKWKIHAATLEDLKNARKKFDQAKNQLQSLESQLDKKNNAEATLEKESEKLQKSLAEKDRQLKESEGKSKELSGRNKELEVRVQSAEKEEKSIQQKVTKIQAELDNNISAMKELQELRVQFADTDVKAKGKQQPLMQELEILKEELEKKEKEGQLALHQLENLRIKHRKLEEELDGVQVEVRRVKELERSKQEMEEQLKVAAGKLKQAEGLVAEYKSKIESSTQDYLDLLTDNKQQEKNIQQQIEKNRELMRQLDEMNTALHAEKQKQFDQQTSHNAEKEQMVDMSLKAKRSEEPFHLHFTKPVRAEGDWNSTVEEKPQHEKRGSEGEKRYISIAHHIVTVEPSMSERIIEKNLNSGVEIQTGIPLDSFGMSNFEPRLLTENKIANEENVVENGELSSAQANGPSAADINRSFAEPSVDSPLIEPRPEVLSSLNGKKNGNAEAVPLAVSNGTVSPPVRRKSDESSRLSRSIGDVAVSTEDNMDQAIPVSQDGTNFPPKHCIQTVTREENSGVINLKLYSLCAVSFGMGAAALAMFRYATR